MQFFKHKKRLSIVAAVLAALLIVPIGTALAADGDDGLYIDGQHIADGETYKLTLDPDDADQEFKLEYRVGGEAKLWLTDYTLTVKNPDAGSTLTGSYPANRRVIASDKLSYALSFSTLSEAHAGQTFTYTFTVKDRANKNAVVSTTNLELTVTGETPAQHSVTVDPDIVNGKITLNNGPYDAVWPGRSVSYNLSADDGYKLVPGSTTVINGQPLSSGIYRTFNMPNEDVVLTAKFAKAYQIDTSAVGEGLHVSTSSYLPGETVTLDFIVNDTYRMRTDSVKITDPESGEELEVDLQYTGVTSGTGINMGTIHENFTFTMPEQDVKLSAQAEADATYALSASSEIQNATVQFSKTTGIGMNETVEYTVTLDSGYRFKGDGQLRTANGTVLENFTPAEQGSFKMPNYDVEMYFETEVAPPTHAITTQIEGGYVTISPNLNGIGYEGDTYTVYLYANSNYVLDGATLLANGGDVELTKSGNGYTFVMPDEDVTLTATLSKQQYAITANSQVKYTGPATAGAGDVVEFTAESADPNYKINSISAYAMMAGGNQQVTDLGGGKYSFVMPAGNVEIRCSRSQIISAINFTTITTDGGRIGVLGTTGMAGNTVTIQVTAGTGYQVKTAAITADDFTVTTESGAPVQTTVSGTNIQFKMPPEPVTVKFNGDADDYFELVNYTITSSVQTGKGKAAIEGGGTTAHFGDKVYVTVTPDEGYEFTNATASYYDALPDYKVEGTNRFSFTMPAKNVTLWINFAVKTSNITAEDVTGGTITLGQSSAAYGSTVTFTVTPDTGYRLVEGSVKVNGDASIVEAAGDGYQFAMTAEDAVVTAAFEKIPYAVNVTAADNGTVTASVQTAGIDDTVTLTVAPEAGYRLVDGSLKVNDGAVAVTDNGNGTYTFTMPNGDVTVTASFEKGDYAVTVGTAENGAVTADVETAQVGDTVTLTVTPDAGYQLTADSLKVNDGAVSVTDNGDGTYTFTMPAGAVEITAAFEKVDYDVLVGTAEHGSLTADVETAQVGDTVTLTVAPDAGYRLKADSLKVNGGDVALTDNGDGTYTFTMPAGVVTVEAAFEEIPEDPTQPGGSEEPGDPTQPGDPQNPAEPGTDAGSGESPVDTGDAALSAIALTAAAAAAAAAAGVVLRRRRAK
ncbi:MAG TPA: hypothetical protein IAB39_00405 [Candidatus Onthovicinus excrementipullorum]|nr:hypothetical protein [Candidatus Onthovicinus excrementipullorum]